MLQKQNGSAPASSEFDNKTNEQIKQEQKLMMKRIFLNYIYFYQCLEQDANLQILLDATNQTHQVALQINDTTKQQNVHCKICVSSLEFVGESAEFYGQGRSPIECQSSKDQHCIESIELL